jgi:hypothetical protein
LLAYIKSLGPGQTPQRNEQATPPPAQTQNVPATATP